MREEIQDLTIIGGGVMGLCTAYAASHFANKITVLEKSTVGDKKTASFSYTRSIRNDYLDPLYTRFAYEARRLWLDLQNRAAEPFLISVWLLEYRKSERHARSFCNLRRTKLPHPYQLTPENRSVHTRHAPETLPAI